MEEVICTLKNMKNRKASGIDKIPMELWKYGGKEIYIRLVQYYLMKSGHKEIYHYINCYTNT